MILAFGCWYIGHALEWRDVLSLPSRYPVADGRETAEPVQFPIVAKNAQGWVVIGAEGKEIAVARRHDGAGQAAPFERLGLSSILKQSNPWWLLAAVGIMAPAFFLQAWRWWLLLRQRRIVLTFNRTLGIHFLGLFCGNFLPGMVGGDLVKAYEVCAIIRQRDATRSGQFPDPATVDLPDSTLADAIMTVVLDRVLGFTGFVLLTALLGTAAVRTPALHDLVVCSWLIAAGFITGMSVILVRNPLHARVAQPFPRWLNPAAELIRALFCYREHPVLMVAATAMSIALSALVVFSTVACGRAVGITSDWGVLIAGLPFVWLVGILPVSFLGFGVMEPLAVVLFAGKGASPTQIIAMLVISRIIHVLFSLPGAVGIFASPVRPIREPE